MNKTVPTSLADPGALRPICLLIFGEKVPNRDNDRNETDPTKVPEKTTKQDLTHKDNYTDPF